MPEPHPLAETTKDSDSIVIELVGSVASGKSTFLSGLHGVLWYHKHGLNIDKDKLEGGKRETQEDAYARLRRGLYRSNATDRPDALVVYGSLNDRIIPFTLYAPGAHTNAQRFELIPDAIIYFLDLELIQSLPSPHAQSFFRFPMGEYHIDDFWEKGTDEAIYDIIDDRRNQCDCTWQDLAKAYGFPEITDRKGLFEKLKTHIVDVPLFGRPFFEEIRPDKGAYTYYRRENLGEVMYSLIRAHAYAIDKKKSLVGVATGKNIVHETLPQKKDELLVHAQEVLNAYIEKFYIYMDGAMEEGNDVQIDFLKPPFRLDNWFVTDLIGTKPYYKPDDPLFSRVSKAYADDMRKRMRPVLNVKNTDLIDISHRIMSDTLLDKNIDPAGLKIVTFSKRDHEKTIPYESVHR